MAEAWTSSQCRDQIVGAGLEAAVPMAEAIEAANQKHLCFPTR
ncbi:MAG: hypothetical protein ACK6BG_00440 [Cyanobacteriota bacterium]